MAKDTGKMKTPAKGPLERQGGDPWVQENPVDNPAAVPARTIEMNTNTSTKKLSDQLRKSKSTGLKP